MRFQELHFLWKAVKAAAIFLGVMLSFFAVVEYIRAYTVLSELSPYAGYAFLVVSALAAAATAGYVVYVVMSRPRAVRPPAIRDKSSATLGELETYCAYLEKYVKRLLRNKNIPEEDIPRLQNALKDFGAYHPRSVSEHELVGNIQRFESEEIDPLLAELDSSAEREIQNCVRDIMIGVSLSPYRAVDLFVVLYRNAIMIVNIIKIYNTRPAFLEQLSIVKDVLSIVAAVNFINFGSRFTEQLMSNVPYIGTIVDDIAQGIGAGLLTSAAGHAATHRCRAYQGWDREESMEMMASKIDLFFRDIYSIFRHDVLPKMRYRVASGETWDKLTAGMSFVFEKMAGIVRSFVRVPAVPEGSAEFENGEESTGRSAFMSAVTAPYSLTKRGIRRMGRSADLFFRKSGKDEEQYPDGAGE